MSELVPDELSGHVVKLISSAELILNVGVEDGVVENDLFDVLDPRTRDVIDPVSGDSLGSIDYVLARVKVFSVAEKMSVARRVSSIRTGSLSAVSQILSGSSGVIGPPVSGRWDDGVEAKFPVKYIGRGNSA